MDFVEYFALMGGALVTVAMIPQIMRVFKLKSAHDISLLFTSFLLVGMVSWLIYGITMKLVQLIIWNSIGVLTVSTLLYAKLKYGRSP